MSSRTKLTACALLTPLLSIPGGAASADVSSGQRGTAVSNTNGTLVDAVTNLDPSKSFLIFQTRHDSTRPVGSLLRGSIASSTTLEFARVTDEIAPTDIVIQWYVVEFSSGVRVQRGETVQTASPIDVTLPLALSSVNQAFVTVSKTPEAAGTSFAAARSFPKLLHIYHLFGDTRRSFAGGAVISNVN